jgi:hypothetical protein
MDWLTGIPSEALAANPNLKQRNWDINVPPLAQPFYLSSFLRGDWQEPDSFPVEELEALGKVKSEKDKVRIWEVFSTAERIQFSGDVLGILMPMSDSYPFPVSPEDPVLEPKQFDGNVNQVILHPGPPSNLNVKIPERNKVYEKKTDWSEHSSGENFGSLNCGTPCFAGVLDQLSLESAEFIGKQGYFPSVMRCKPVPWRKLALISRNLSHSHSIQIVKDWGLIMREALGSPAGPSANQAQWNLERAVLRFLIKRIAYDKIDI